MKKKKGWSKGKGRALYSLAAGFGFVLAAVAAKCFELISRYAMQSIYMRERERERESESA